MNFSFYNSLQGELKKILQTEENDSQFHWECINHNVPEMAPFNSCVAAVDSIMYQIVSMNMTTVLTKMDIL